MSSADLSGICNLFEPLESPSSIAIAAFLELETAIPAGQRLNRAPKQLNVIRPGRQYQPNP
jgi:hypothetical protein